jgi:exodeoxyribonuclease VII large subunit
VADEVAAVRQARDRVRRAVQQLVTHEERQLTALRSRPALAAPHAGLAERRATVAALRDRARRILVHRLDRAGDEVGHRLARARALSPLATLRRGYALVQAADGRLLTTAAAAAPGDPLTVRLHDGRLSVLTESVTPDPEEHGDE